MLDLLLCLLLRIIRLYCISTIKCDIALHIKKLYIYINTMGMCSICGYLEWVSSSPLGLSTQVKDILTDPSKHLFSFLFIILWFQAHLCHDFLKKIDCIKENSANFNLISFVLKHNYVLKQMI